MSKPSLKMTIAAGALSMLSLTAHAQDMAHPTLSSGTGYIGLSGGNFDYENSASVEAELKGIALEAGLFLEDRWAFEVRGGTGFDDDSVELGAGGATSRFSSNTILELDNYYSAYLGRHFEISEKGSFYTMLGVSNVNMRTQVPSASENTFSETGPSFAVGLEAHPTNRMSISVEYAQLVDEDAIKIDALTFGIQSHFDAL